MDHVISVPAIHATEQLPSLLLLTMPPMGIIKEQCVNLCHKIYNIIRQSVSGYTTSEFSHDVVFLACNSTPSITYPAKAMHNT